MATCSFTILLEIELLDDVINAITRMHEALPKRHGAAFRRLERKLEKFGSGERPIGEPELRALGGGRFILIPPKALFDLVDEAQRLGVV